MIQCPTVLGRAARPQPRVQLYAYCDVHTTLNPSDVQSYRRIVHCVHIARKCGIFSPKQDSEPNKKFCTKFAPIELAPVELHCDRRGGERVGGWVIECVS